LPPLLPAPFPTLCASLLLQRSTTHALLHQAVLFDHSLYPRITTIFGFVRTYSTHNLSGHFSRATLLRRRTVSHPRSYATKPVWPPYSLRLGPTLRSQKEAVFSPFTTIHHHRPTLPPVNNAQLPVLTSAFRSAASQCICRARAKHSSAPSKSYPPVESRCVFEASPRQPSLLPPSFSPWMRSRTRTPKPLRPMAHRQR